MVAAAHTRAFGKPQRSSGGAVTGAVALALRLEAALVVVGAVLAYHSLGAGWLLFAVLFLAPDISMAAYAFGPRAGAVGYNLVHTYLAPAFLALIGAAAGLPVLYGPALIWTAHIGFDRLLGYGLKYPSAFADTHLGRIGRDRSHGPPTDE